MNDQITITLSGGDRFGQFNVHARCGDAEYPDFFNPLNAWRRKVFAENVASRFGWEGTADQLEQIEEALLVELRRLEKAAGNQDERVEAPTFREMRGEEIEWLWPGRIAVGKLCVIAGDPGLGKSLLTLDIAAHASRGAPWPDESGFSPVASVFLLSAEDDYGDTVRPRLVAAGADLDRVFAVTGVYWGEGEQKTGRNLDISQDLEKLRKTIESVPPPRVLVIDPISSFLGAAGENANAEIRKLLEPVTVFAQETKTAVIIVSHMRKAEGSNLHRIIGSIAFAAVARSAFVVVRVKDVSGQLRRLIPVKNNLGGTKSLLEFEVIEHGELGKPCIVWGDARPHDGLDVPPTQLGRNYALKPEEIAAIDALLAAGPATLAEIAELVKASGVNISTLQRLVQQRYRWLEEKRGRARLVALRETDISAAEESSHE